MRLGRAGTSSLLVPHYDDIAASLAANAQYFLSDLLIRD
jgi:hypothetical protein